MDSLRLMRNGLEWLRIVTPFLCGINLFILTQLYAQLNELNNRIYQHQTNAELHVTRAEFVAIQSQLEQVHRDIVETIRRNHDGL